MNTGDGDANSDLWVDSQDLEAWQTEYPAAVAASVAVPEPGAVVLFFGTCLVCLSRR